MLVILLLAFGSVLAVPSSRKPAKCGYESCTQPKEGVLNVHIVPHTHDDVGWLKTVDQYYYGHRNNIQKAGVQYILDSVVKELLADPERRFIYVESAFFAKWWHEQTPALQSQVHTLVEEGRLKFVGGAWSMNDEATTYYQSIIDQFTYGLSFLNETFGACGRPTVGWQIDPFGHSREFASLLAGMGYDGLFLGRIDYQDKANRMKMKEMEFLWRGDDNLGKSSDIFTGILYNTYSPPPGFCFDVLCNDDPIIDDPTSPDYNVDSRVSKFIDYVQKQSKVYTTNNVIVTMGGDFTYQEASMWYKNLDKLIKYGNKKATDENLKVNLFYSTPDCYLKAVKDANPVLPIKQDDFFPYASDPHAYWTGYFTSRPTIKFIEVETNRYTQMAKQLFTLADLSMDKMEVLNKLKAAMGILQHHDAITGTEKQHVTYDYIRLTFAAINDVHEDITTAALNKLIIGDKKDIVLLKFDRCHFNESACETSEKSQGNMIVTAYNPLAWSVSTPIRIPITENQMFKIKDSEGNLYTNQKVPIPPGIQNIPHRNSKATHELVFIATLPPLGYKTFYLEKVAAFRKREVAEYEQNNEIEDGTLSVKNEIQNDDPMIVQWYADEPKVRSSTLEPHSCVEAVLNDTTYSGKCWPAYYPGFIGNNEVYENRSSGAYIFRPYDNDPSEISYTKLDTVEGSVVDEFWAISSDNEEDYSRSYKDERIKYKEVKWLVGPIDIKDGVGKEYVYVYQMDFDNNGEFYTDSNGRTVLKRIFDKRPTWNLTLGEPVAGNYYPVVDYAGIKQNVNIKDVTWSLNVVNDRPQGVTSKAKGELEFMLHRRLLHDDAFGVGEALNETAQGKGLIVTGTHRVYYDYFNNFTFKPVLEMRMQPEVFVSDAADIPYEKFVTLNTEKSFLKDNLDDGVHLLTLEPWNEDKLLLRFENYLEKSDKKVDLDNILSDVKIETVQEMLLSADKLKADYTQWVWRNREEFAEDFNTDYGNPIRSPRAVDRIKKDDNGKIINLDAKQIRTFLVQYNRV